MKDIFTPKLHPKVRPSSSMVRPNDILGKQHNTITYGTKSLKTLGRYGTNYQRTLNHRHFIPNLRNILTFSSDLNVHVMCA